MSHSSNVFTSRFLLIGAALVALSYSGTVIAGTFTVFGPESYERGKGTPQTIVNSFSVPSTDTTYFLALENGPDGTTKVSSAVITINGVEVVAPEALNQQVTQLEYAVPLNETNEIAVELRGIPLGRLSIEVFGIDDDLPTISAVVVPEPNQNGWNKEDVIVSFECLDQTSGIATCTGAGAVDFETNGEVVTGTAIDNAGNMAQASVTIRLDKTLPEIGRAWPPADDFSTDRSDIGIEGRVEDALSGVDTIELLDAQGIVVLGSPEFAETRTLNTDIAPGTLWTDNAFELQAVDRAGNAVAEGFVVRHTQVPHTLPTDPVRTELVGGLLTSVETAIVRFGQSVDREIIDSLIAQAGGRVVGYLPATNTATALFETDQVLDLQNVVDSLRSNAEVEVAVPAIFLPEIQLDNELLSPVESASYDNIRSAQAKDQVIPQIQVALDPVRIAVIETGMDDSHGQNNEFSNINFYDLCTTAGQLGQTGTPVDTPNAHGTKITGIVAGANNGAGNNGVIRGIPASQFDVNVFRMNCGNGNDPALIVAAMDLIIARTLGDFDVVNMSFGGLFNDPAVRDNVRAIYAGYFDSPAGREILWVGGAGNDNQDIDCNEFLPSGLACDLDNVISVGGYDAADLSRGIWISSSGDTFGSNYGAGVTLSAPGTSVWTATGVGTYGGVNGTSAATPLVTGAAALMLAANPLSPVTVKQLLVSNTQQLQDATLPEGGLDVLSLLQAGRSYVDIAFVSERNGNDEIYGMNADGTNQTNLTNNAAQDFWPRWSPDGQQLVFVSTRASDNVDIYVMNADGSGVTRLTTDPGLDTKPSWSPDGQWIAFTSDRTGDFRNYLLQKQGNTWSPPLPVPATASTYDFTWSPDGLWLVFSGYDSGVLNVGRKDLYRFNLQDGVGVSNLTETPDINEVWPTWHPGQRIVFSSISDIFSIEPDGSAKTRLTQALGQDNIPIWSPYGRRIAFSSFRDGNWEAYAMNADGSQQTNLTNHPGADAGGLEESFLSWSPDGDKVVYWTDRDGNLEIYVADINSLVNTRLTTIGSRDYFPQWRP